jgi:hypothetical protein
MKNKSKVLRLANLGWQNRRGETDYLGPSRMAILEYLSRQSSKVLQISSWGMLDSVDMVKPSRVVNSDER